MSNPSSPTEEKKQPSQASSKYIGQPLYPLQPARKVIESLSENLDGLGIDTPSPDSSVGSVANKAVSVTVNPRFGQVAIGTEK